MISFAPRTHLIVLDVRKSLPLTRDDINAGSSNIDAWLQTVNNEHPSGRPPFSRYFNKRSWLCIFKLLPKPTKNFLFLPAHQLVVDLCGLDWNDIDLDPQFSSAGSTTKRVIYTFYMMIELLLLPNYSLPSYNNCCSPSQFFFGF